MQILERIKVELPEIFQYKFELPVLISDINHGNHLSNDAVYRMVNEGRVRFLKELSLDDFDIGDGISAVTSGTSLQYTSIASYGDMLKIRVAYMGCKTALFNLAFQISQCKDDKEVARALISLVCVDAKNEKLVKVPASFIEKINRRFN